MVAPTGTTKLAISLRTPMRFFTVSKVTGSVAPLDAVLNANAITGAICW